MTSPLAGKGATWRQAVKVLGEDYAHGPPLPGRDNRSTGPLQRSQRHYARTLVNKRNPDKQKLQDSDNFCRVFTRKIYKKMYKIVRAANFLMYIYSKTRIAASSKRA